MRVDSKAWANNGDAVSQQYAGTCALKGDFTRTGRRRMRGLGIPKNKIETRSVLITLPPLTSLFSLLGKLNDGVNSMTRYVINNFYDGLRQVSLSLSLFDSLCKHSRGFFSVLFGGRRRSI